MTEQPHQSVDRTAVPSMVKTESELYVCNFQLTFIQPMCLLIIDFGLARRLLSLSLSICVPAYMPNTRAHLYTQPNKQGAVADPEGVPWVLWNPSFEGLPSKILFANILRRLCSHWSYALWLHSSMYTSKIR